MDFGFLTPYWGLALIVTLGGLAYALLVIRPVERNRYDHGLGGILAVPTGGWDMFWYGYHAGVHAGLEVCGYLCMAAVPSIVVSLANYMRRRAEDERVREQANTRAIREMEEPRV